MTTPSISKNNRVNEYIYNLANHVLRQEYDNDSSLLPRVMKCLFHDGLMSCLQKTGMLSELVFHGGTCLQRIYGSPRLSEDLDFCVRQELPGAGDFEKFCADLEGVFRSDFAPAFQIANEDIFFREPKKSMEELRKGEVLTWRIGIIVALGAARQVIKIDVENRCPCTLEEVRFKPLADIPAFGDIFLYAQSRREILVNKILSIFQRKRLQYRDCFDTGFLAQSWHDVDRDLLHGKIDSLSDPDSLARNIAERKALFREESFWEDYRAEMEKFLAPGPRKTFLTKQAIAFSSGILARAAEEIEEYLEPTNDTGPCP